MTRIPHAAYTLDPDARRRHTAVPAGEEERAGQALQTPEAVAAAADEKLPAGQSVQALGPGAVLYLPTTHAVQALPSGPV